MTSRRNTIQKDLVRNTVYEMRRHVTANEVYELDVYKRQIDGFELCKRIRALVDCPILFLTAKTEENSLVNGLDVYKRQDCSR